MSRSLTGRRRTSSHRLVRPGHTTSESRRPVHVIDELRRRRSEVLALWKQAAHVPSLAAQQHELFDHLLERASVIDAGHRVPIIEHPLRTDLLAGHDLGQLVRVYTTLREEIAHVIEHHRAIQLRTLRAVHQAIDEDLTSLIEIHTRHVRRAAELTDAALATERAQRTSLADDNARLIASTREAIAARDRVLAIVSHDLRNPLGAIGMLTTLLKDRADDDPHMAEELAVVEQGVEQMKRLISDLVDMSSIDTGKLRIQRGRVDIGALIHDAVATHGPRAVQREITLAHDIQGAALVHADRVRIGQVLGNLLGNALKFCQAGDTITLRVRTEPEHVVFAVADTGPGIAADDLAHIFEPFWSAREHAREGTGLGLFICKGIVEAHGGQIRAESQPGSGTTVSFTLPIAR